MQVLFSRLLTFTQDWQYLLSITRKWANYCNKRVVEI